MHIYYIKIHIHVLVRQFPESEINLSYEILILLYLKRTTCSTPYEFYTPPMEEFKNVSYKGNVNSK